MAEFEKNDVIFSESIGVCRGVDIQNLSADKKSPIRYYLLISIYDKNRTSYIPVSDHKVMLRRLISYDEAKNREGIKGKGILEEQEVNYVLSQGSEGGKSDV